MHRLQWVHSFQALAAAERAAQPHPNEISSMECEMADDPQKTGLDRNLVALNEPHEICSWMESYGCTEAQLRAAVQKVGHSADKVRTYLDARQKAAKARPTRRVLG